MEVLILALDIIGFCLIGWSVLRRGAQNARIFLASVLFLSAMTVTALLAGVGAVECRSGFGICLTLTAASALFFLLGLYGRKRQLAGHRRFMAKAALVLVLLECLVFNFPTLHMLLSDAPAGTLPLENAEWEHFSGNEARYENGFKPAIQVQNVGAPVETLVFDLELPDHVPYLYVNVQYTDSTNALRLRGDVSHKIVRGIDETRYLRCDFSGEVGTLRIEFQLEKEQSFRLRGIQTNLPVPFSFSALRVGVLFLLILGVYLLGHAQKLKRTVEESPACLRKVACAVTCVVMLSALCVPLLTRDHNGDQMTEELVDAFRAGQVSLLEEPSPELLALENPYDRSQRDAAQVSYKWDHLLFEGKYYSYYGIAPVLLLFLPYNLLTGGYMPSIVAVALFSLLGILFLSQAYLCLIEKKFPGLPVNIAVSGLLLLQITCGIVFSYTRPNFYEIAVSSGFACVAAGAYYLLRSGVLWGEKIKYRHLALAATLFALAVLCRPTLAMYCFPVVLAVLLGTKRQWAEHRGAGRRAGYLLCGILPFVLIGGVQMAYNYMRFGSVFDFGIQYSLTINDFTHTEFHFSFVWLSLFAFLFACPYLVPRFPYVTSSFDRLSARGYYYVDDGHVSGIAIGLFMKALPMWGYFKIRKAYGLMDKATRKRDMLLLVAFCLIAPLVIICSVWESGYAVRYTADFNWQLLIGALVILFIVYVHEQNPVKRHYMELFFTASVVWGFVVCFGQFYHFMYHYTSNTPVVATDGFTLHARSILLYIENLFRIFR